MLLCCKSSAAVWTAEERGGEWEHRQTDGNTRRLERLKTVTKTKTRRDDDVKRCIWDWVCWVSGSLGRSSKLVNLPINSKEYSLCSFLLQSVDTLHQINSTGLKLTTNTTCSWKAFGPNGNRFLTGKEKKKQKRRVSTPALISYFFLSLCFTWREKPGTAIITV